MRYSQVVLICAICGKKFSVYKYREEKAKYCDQKCYGLYRKTVPAPTKGRTFPERTKENHWNWKKDRSQIKGYWKERNNPEYKKWRKAIFERDDYRCMDCGERKGEIEADHIYSWAKYPRLRYILENGQTLCKICHKIKTRNSFISTR